MGRNVESADGPSETQFSLRAILIVIAAVAVASAIAAPFVRSWPPGVQLRFGAIVATCLGGAATWMVFLLFLQRLHARRIDRHKRAGNEAWGDLLLRLRFAERWSLMFRCLAAMVLTVNAFSVYDAASEWLFPDPNWPFPLQRPTGSPMMAFFMAFCAGFTAPVFLNVIRGRVWKCLAFYENGVVRADWYFLPWPEFLKDFQWDARSGRLAWSREQWKNQWQQDYPRMIRLWQAVKDFLLVRCNLQAVFMRIPDPWWQALGGFSARLFGFDALAPRVVVPVELRDEVGRILAAHARTMCEPSPVGELSPSG